jgi:hypothetical protein
MPTLDRSLALVLVLAGSAVVQIARAETTLRA